MRSLRLRTWLLVFAVATTFVGIAGKTLWDFVDRTPAERLRSVCDFHGLPLPEPMESIEETHRSESGPFGSDGSATLQVRCSPEATKNWTLEVARKLDREWLTAEDSGRFFSSGSELSGSESSLQLPIEDPRGFGYGGTYLFADAERGIIEFMVVWD